MPRDEGRELASAQVSTTVLTEDNLKSQQPPPVQVPPRLLAAAFHPPSVTCIIKGVAASGAELDGCNAHATSLLFKACGVSNKKTQRFFAASLLRCKVPGAICAPGIFWATRQQEQLSWTAN